MRKIRQEPEKFLVHWRRALRVKLPAWCLLQDLFIQVRHGFASQLDSLTQRFRTDHCNQPRSSPFWAPDFLKLGALRTGKIAHQWRAECEAMSPPAFSSHGRDLFIQ